MAEPLTCQDSWQDENCDYLAKDGKLWKLVKEKLHSGDYELIKDDDDPFVHLKARVTITFDLSILTDDEGNIRTV